MDVKRKEKNPVGIKKEKNKTTTLKQWSWLQHRHCKKKLIIIKSYGRKRRKKKDHHTKRAVLMTAQALIDAQFT